MKPVSVFPGKVKYIISHVLWRDHHLLFYSSDDGEIVILDDESILDIIPLNKTAAGQAPACAINRESGNLVICAAGKALIYEAIALYGQDPRWERLTSFELNKDEPKDIAWINKNTFLITTTANDLIAINYKENRIVWRKEMGVNRLALHEETGLAVVYGAEELFVVNFDKNSENLDCSLVTSIDSTNVNSVWFVSPGAIAVNSADGALYIWRIDGPAQLLASLPQETKQPILAAPSYDNSVLLANGGQCARLILLDAYPQVEEVELGIDFSKYNFVDASVDRFYGILENGEMHIFAIDETSATRLLGRVRGVENSGAPNLSVNKTTVVAGASVLSSEYEILNGLHLPNIILSEFVQEDELLVATNTTELCLYIKGELKWSQKLSRLPKAIGGNQDHLYALYSDVKIDVFNKEGRMSEPCTLQTEVSHIDHGIVKGSHLLINNADTVECWDLVSETLHSKGDFEDSKIVCMALSPQSSVCVAYTRERESYIQYWNKLTCPIPTTVSLGSCSIVSAAWSSDSKSLAVLTTNSLSVYAAVSQFRGNLIQIAEMPVANNSLSRFLLNTSIDWSYHHSDQLLIFNGKQLLVIEVGLDSCSERALIDYALELEPGQNRLTYLVSEFNSPIPIYHPDMLILCMQALHPQIYNVIIKKLGTEIKYGDLNEAGNTVLLHPSLKIEDFENLDSDFSGYPLIDEEQLRELLQNLEKYRLRGLTQADQGALSSLVSLTTPWASRLDNYGLCALLLAAKTHNFDSAKFWTYAWLSDTKAELSAALDMLPQNVAPTPSSSGTKVTTQVKVWLDRDDLQSHLYQIARKKFAETRDPTTVMLLYVALHKLPDLLKLWRIASGHPEREKTLKLLNNDFETPRWKTAAQKNAYALLGRHRYEYAAAFFLLGDSVKDCCQVCIDKLNDFPLAIAITRVYEGDHGDGMKFLRDRYFSDNNTVANGEDSLWLQFFIEWMAQEYSEALENLISGANIDCSAVLPFSMLGGQVNEDLKKQWLILYEQAGVIPAFSNALIKPLATQDLPENNVTEEVTPAPAPPAASELENRDLPSNLKAAPSAAELEPDMSAFGF